MPGGFVNVNFAKSVVVIETGRLTDQQFAQVKRILGEAFGSVMVQEIPVRRLEVSWYVHSAASPRKLRSRLKGQANTPARLRDVCHSILQQSADSIGIEVAELKDY